MSDRAFLFIDIQNDYFEGGNWPVALMDQVAQNAAELLGIARKKGEQVIHIRHEATNPAVPFFQPGTTGAEIHNSVSPQDGEEVILKHRPNSFHETTLMDVLRTNKITKLVLCGAMSQMCIDATTRAAVDFGFEVSVIEDACGAKEQNFNGEIIPAELVHKAFMAPLAMSYAKVLTLHAFLQQES